MKALMSYTSSFLEWLGRYVGLLVFGLLFVTTLFNSHDHDDGIL